MDDLTNNDCKMFNDILNIYEFNNNIDICTHQLGHKPLIIRKIDEMKLAHTEPGSFLCDHRFVRIIFDDKNL